MRGWHRCSSLSAAAVSCQLKMRKVVLMVKVLKAWKGFRKKLGSLSATSLGSTVSSMLGARGAHPTEGSDTNEPNEATEPTSRLRIAPDASNTTGAAHSALHSGSSPCSCPYSLCRVAVFCSTNASLTCFAYFVMLSVGISAVLDGWLAFFYHFWHSVHLMTFSITFFDCICIECDVD